jgi:hypothetical protein
MPSEYRSPGRFARRLKIVGFLILLAVAGCISLYWVWGQRNWNRLASERAALKAAGHPVSVADLARPAVPDARNAALLLRQAARSINQSTADWRALDEMEWPPEGSRLPLLGDEKALLENVVKLNGAALALVERARHLPEFDWQIDYSVGALNIDLKFLGEQRALANLLRAAALSAHDRGDDRQALGYVSQIKFIARAVAHESTLISALVSSGIDGMHSQLLGDIAPTLKISTTDPQAITPQQARQLIDSLLDPTEPRMVIRGGLVGERAIQQSLMDDLMAGKMGLPAGPGAPPANPLAPQLMSFAFGPMMKDNALLMLRHMTRQIGALDAPDWPAFQKLAGEEPPQIRNGSYRYLYARLLIPALGRASLVGYRAADDRALAACAVATRWYSIDHDGALPASLGDLVGSYLPRIPRDVLAGGDALIGCVNDKDRPRVYHVGDNGKDDGGREPVPSASARDNNARSDRVVYLKHLPRPTTAPASQD